MKRGERCGVRPAVLRSAADFERVLALPACQRSAHFAIHHLARTPLVKRLSNELSTDVAPTEGKLVDDSLGGLWLGSVVPKRHARRAATRNLLKRQIRHCVASRAGCLPPGLWVVRLKQGFDKSAFPSAQSAALRSAAAGELLGLLDRLVVHA